MGRHSNPMPRMNRNSDDSESRFSYDSNGMPIRSEKKKCCSKKCWGRNWRTDLCCCIPALATQAGTPLMIMFCNGALDCRNVPEGFSDDAENWTDEQWKEFFDLNNSGEIPAWLGEQGDADTQGIVRNFYGGMTDWLYEYLLEGDADDIDTLYDQADHIFGAEN